MTKVIYFETIYGEVYELIRVECQDKSNGFVSFYDFPRDFNVLSEEVKNNMSNTLKNYKNSPHWDYTWYGKNNFNKISAQVIDIQSWWIEENNEKDVC